MLNKKRFRHRAQRAASIWLLGTSALLVSFLAPLLPTSFFQNTKTASAATTTEEFETPGPTTGVLVKINGTTSVTTSNQNGWYYANMSNQYGTTGYTIYASYPSAPLDILFPDGSDTRSFSFVVGAKNGNETATAYYSDNTTETFTVGNSVLTAGCSTCQAPGYYRVVSFQGNGTTITKFRLPGGSSDVYFVDTLTYEDTTTATTTTTTTTTPTTTTTVPLTTTLPPDNGIDGLDVDGWNFDPADGSPPTFPERDPDLYDSCGSAVVEDINTSFDGNPFEDCGSDFFMLRYQGFVTVPENETVSFRVWADDGGIVTIDGNSFGDWNLKGCQISEPTDFELSAGSYEIEAWFYEWGGGTCFHLQWNIDEEGWEFIPASAFSRESVQSPQTTVPPQTTIAPETTIAPQTTAAPETSAPPPPTSTPPAPPPAPAENNNQSPPTGTTVPEPPSTTQPPPETTLPEPDESVPETTAPEQSSTPTTPPKEESTKSLPPPTAPQPTVEDTQPDEELPQPTPTTEPKSIDAQQEDITQVPTEQLFSETEELLDNVDPEQKAEAVKALVETLIEDKSPDELTPEDKEKVVAVVSAIISSGVTEEVAQTLASNAAVLASVSSEQAAQVFEQVEAESLTEEVAAAIVDAVQEAPAEIRETFEEVVDLFAGAFDEYMMLGQTINVGQRRTVVAVNLVTTTVTTGAALAGAGSSGPTSRTSSSPTSDTAARKEDEEEEPSGEIAGDGLDWIQKISIFRYENGVRVLDWLAFIKKFLYGFLNMGFTLAGSLVVFLTLSGPIQRIAGITTVLAFAGAMWLHMKEPEDE